MEKGRGRGMESGRKGRGQGVILALHALYTAAGGIHGERK